MLHNSALLALEGVTPFEGLVGEIDRAKNVIRATYDFAVQGGAIGSVVLKDREGNDAKLPAKAIITRSFVDVITQPTSAGAATVAVHAESAADILGATAKASLPVGQLTGKQDNTVANFVKTSVERKLKADIAVAALTAGKFHVFVEYVLSE
jgi:hypothetical protein